jgi:hypothetical protein
MTLKVHISQELQSSSPELKYILQIWARGNMANLEFVDSPRGALTVGVNENNTVKTSISNRIHDQLPSPEADPLTSAFYMLNSLQEHTDENPDELGRFRYSSSYQSRLGNSRANLVQQCFDEISRKVGVTPRKEKTRFFLSHDIDLVNGAIIEDGFNVMKKGRIDLFLGMLFRVALGRPDWLNMDKIMKLESEYDCKSAFFWIMNKGRINAREENADYSFQSTRIQNQFLEVEKNGFDNGLHKSLSTESFKEEFLKYGSKPLSNRYHYLKYHLPHAYYAIEDAGLKLDASLGFAEEIGFRNSYGLPFNPYDLENRKPFSFVEVPLHIMDRTFFQYKKSTVERAEKDIFEFFEMNRENCVLSVLWHNNFFTDYKFKGYLALYKKILAYIKENECKTISQQEIINKYSIVN